MSNCNSKCETCPFGIATHPDAIMFQDGCLPTPLEIDSMMDKYKTDWSCHDNGDKLCPGWVKFRAKNDKPFGKGLPLFNAEVYLEYGEGAAKFLLDKKPTLKDNVRSKIALSATMLFRCSTTGTEALDIDIGTFRFHLGKANENNPWHITISILSKDTHPEVFFEEPWLNSENRTLEDALLKAMRLAGIPESVLEEK